jgi:Flp pilus assembly protein TadD
MSYQITSKLVHVLTKLTFVGLLAGVAPAQELPVSSDRISADTNSAIIEGKVSLPSGFSADRNVKITLKNSRSTLYTIYSNKHGEFRFHDLGEGVYYVQAEVGRFESRVEKIPLGRGITYEVTLHLIDRTGHDLHSPSARVISVAELRQPVPAPAEKEYKLGLKFVAKGNFSQAAGHFQQALALYPEYLAARNDLGAQYLKLKRLDEAEELFRHVLESDPKNFYAMFNLGLVRIERRDYAEAVSRLQKAISVDSAWPTARLWLGFALLEMGDLASAERELTKALIMGGPDCVAAHYHLARAYVKRGDPAEASRALRSYLEESPRGEYAKEARELARKLAHDKHAGSK